MLPSDVLAALPASMDPANVTAHAHLHTSIDSPLGESHLVACGARVVALTRRSPFEPFRAVPLANGGLRYEESGFTRKLTLVTAEGDTHVVEISILDVASVQQLVGAASAPGPATKPALDPAPIAEPARRAIAEPTPRAALAPDEDRAPMRAKLLGVLKARPKRHEPVPFPGYERYVARTAHLPGVPSPKWEPPATPAVPRKNEHEEKTKKRKKERRADRARPAREAKGSGAHAEPSPQREEPLLRAWHWFAILVIAPLIFLAFVWVSRVMH